jgi:tetratricopeptide (TPR) repeat protein
MNPVRPSRSYLKRVEGERPCVESPTELHRLTDDAEARACERAWALLVEGKLLEAEREAGRAARALERGGERWLLAESLTTRGVALARLARADEARAALLRAAEVAERAGNTEQAGRALLAAVEELGARMSKDELCATYERAARLLSASPDVDALRRLSGCARRVLLLLDERAVPSDWDNFSFREAVLRYESGIIVRALKDAGGVVSRAAQLLGMKHHNNLVSILNTRHHELLGERKPIVARRRSLVTRRKR